MWISYYVPPCHTIQVGPDNQGPIMSIVEVRPSILDHTEYPYCMAIVVDTGHGLTVYHPDLFVSCMVCMHPTIPRVK